MFRLFFVIIAFGFLNSSINYQSDNTKTYTDDLMSFEYKDSWKVFIDHGLVSLCPKKIFRKNKYSNILSIKKQSFDKYSSIESAIAEEIDIVIKYAPGDINVTQSISSSKYGDVHSVRFKYTVESIPKIKECYFVKYNNSIFNFEYLVSASEYENYYNDVLLILNSVEFK